MALVSTLMMTVLSASVNADNDNSPGVDDNDNNGPGVDALMITMTDVDDGDDEWWE